MKKIIEKDKKLRKFLKLTNKQNFVLKSIFKNLNFSNTMRWKAFLILNSLTNNNSSVSLSSKCVLTENKKKYHKLTLFSRYVFLKLIRFGFVSGFKKASW